MITIGLVLVFVGLLIGFIAEKSLVFFTAPPLGCLVLLVGVLPCTAAIIVACVIGWLVFMYAGIALTAYWRRRYDWANDSSTPALFFSVAIAPVYVVLGLIIWAGVVVWDTVTENT